MASKKSIEELRESLKANPLPKPRTGRYIEPADVAETNRKALAAVVDIGAELAKGAQQKRAVEAASKSHGLPVSTIEAVMFLHRQGHLDDDALFDKLANGTLSVGQARKGFTKPKGSA